MTTRGWIRYPLGRGVPDYAELDRRAEIHAQEMGGRVLKVFGEQIIAGKRYYRYRIEKTGEA